MTQVHVEAGAYDFVSRIRINQRTLLADELYRALRASLLAEEIEPGAKLNLDELARRLHVSNTPVRQALARLESDGLVVNEPYRGFFAAPPIDIDRMEEVYDLRLLIEPAAASRTASLQPGIAAQRLLPLCDTAELELEAETRPDAHHDAEANLDGNFHFAIAEASGSQLLYETVVSTLRRMSGYPIQRVRSASVQAWIEHRHIAEAIAGGDADEAEAAMRAHLTCSVARYRKIDSLREAARRGVPLV